MPEVCPIIVSPTVKSLSVEILMYSVLLFHLSTLPEPDSVNTFSPSIKLFFLSFDVNSGKSPFLITLPEEDAASLDIEQRDSIVGAIYGQLMEIET